MTSTQLCYYAHCKCFLAWFTEEELAKERRKLNEAIGYSESAKLTTFPEEVHMYMYIHIHVQCTLGMEYDELRMSFLLVSVCGSSLEL